MNVRKIVLTLSLCFVAAALAFAGNPNMGTWKLNEAKSKFSGPARNFKVSYEAAGDDIKVVVDGVDADGKPTHNTWTGKMDGKDYPLVGDPAADTRSYKMIDDRTTELTNKKDGKVTLTGRIVIAPDGKSRTITISGADSMGKEVSYTAYYDKE
jgi:hypothetical protein